MTFSTLQMLEAELMRFFSGQWQSGTGVNAGPITGYPTGGNTHDPSHPTDYSDGTNGSDNLGSQDYCDNQPISSDSFYDENGNLIFIDMTIRAPELVPGGPSNTIDFIFDRVSYAEYRIQVFVDGDFAHRDILADHPGWLYETIDEHFEPGHVHDDETGGNKFSVRATFGTAMRDVISASGLLFGEGGDDGLTGGAGSDTIDGGEGNDWLDGGAGGDLLDGGAGWDVVSYLAMAGGIIVDMTTNQNGGAALGDKIVDVEVVQGTNANDTIIGIDRGNGTGVQLYGEGGNDGLTGKAGGDALFGGAGNDWLDGGAGGDLLDGGAGWDVVSYLAMAGGVVVDMTTNQNGGAALGDKIVDVEVVQGTNANDTIIGVDRGNGMGVQLYGEAGDDGLVGKAGGDALYGGAGNDWLDGGAGGDLLDGGAGWDVVSYLAMAGGIIVDMTTNQNGGAALGDRLVDIEVVQGTNANDRIVGVERAGGNGVQLYGEGGDDGLVGKAGGDALFGGAGNDWLDGGAGGDILDGGDGWDVVSYLAMAGGIVVDMTTNQNGGAALGDRLVNIEVVQGTNANDTIVGVDRGNGSGVELHGEGGNDGLTGRAGSDRLFGDAGADTLAGGAGGDTLDGGNGDDSLSGDAGADLIDGGAGRDIATYAAATSGVSVSLEAGIGSLGDAAGDRLVSIEGLTGSAYADQLVGDVFDNTLSGGNGFDLLNGGDGADTLDGGAGNDTLAGGAGSDLLTGGQGRDVFTFDWAPTGASNLDRIQDFNASEDKILLKGSVFTGLAAGALSARAFTVGAEATSKEHRIVYNEATGEVSYDVDGSGARAAIKFAVLTPGATLWADHFLVG